MKLTLRKALLLAVFASVLPACERSASDTASGGASSGQTPAGGATGQASEGSTDERKAPARPSSGY